jgi:hypothetical protein
MLDFRNALTQKKDPLKIFLHISNIKIILKLLSSKSGIKEWRWDKKEGSVTGKLDFLCPRVPRVQNSIGVLTSGKSIHRYVKLFTDAVSEAKR